MLSSWFEKRLEIAVDLLFILGTVVIPYIDSVEIYFDFLEVKSCYYLFMNSFNF